MAATKAEITNNEKDNVKSDINNVQMDENLVSFGYIHRHINSIYNKYDINLLFPDGIILITILYLQPYFEWDPKNCAKAFQLSNNNTIAKYAMDRNGSILSKNIISSKKYNYVEWEIRLSDFKFICIAFGFIEYPISKSITDLETQDFLTKQYQYSVYIHYDKYTHSFEACNGNTTIETITKIKLSDIKDGDTFKLIFDFIKMQCSFHYNDKFVAILAKDLKDDTKYIPAMAVYRSYTIECTKWLLQRKMH